MNSPQAHLRLQKAREERLQYARQRRFDEKIFLPLETPSYGYVQQIRRNHAI